MEQKWTKNKHKWTKTSPYTKAKMDWYVMKPKMDPNETRKYKKWLNVICKMKVISMLKLSNQEWRICALRCTELSELSALMTSALSSDVC